MAGTPKAEARRRTLSARSEMLCYVVQQVVQVGFSAIYWGNRQCSTLLQGRQDKCALHEPISECSPSSIACMDPCQFERG